MYKVFLNDRLILIDAPRNITLNKPSFKFEHQPLPSEIRTWFENFSISDEKEIALLHQQPDQLFSRFRQAFHQVAAAGGVLKSEGRLLFIYRHSKWDLPKGKMDIGETPEDTALREVEEETGIRAEKIVRQLPSTFHLYQTPYNADRHWILKETYWFEMMCPGTPEGQPQHSEGIMQLKWIALDSLEAVLSNTYENLKQIITLYRA